MPLTRVRFDVVGTVFYSRAFETMAREAEDLSEPFGDVAEVIRSSVGEQFRTEGAHAGSPWQRLTASYRAWKERNFGTLPILVRTAAMRTAALSRAAFTISPRRLVYEVDSDYAIYHQKGEGHMPQRRIVDLSHTDRRDIDHAFAAWLTSLRRGAIGG